jgi:Flp pilus assembly protein TadD
VRSIALVTIAATILLLSLWTPPHAMAGGAEQQVCDVGADYSLGAEDYAEAIRRHVEVVRKFPENALAHYHLGFALGMVGDKIAEVREYQRAEALGLKTWDLFLNLGLAQLENGDLDAATNSLQRSVLLGENHPESHFNLALVDERSGKLADAEHQTLASLRFNPAQPDARNLLGVVYAQEGDTDRAYLTWSELVRDVPDYEPARTNLAILGNPIANGETAAVDLPRAAAVNAMNDESELLSPASEVKLRQKPARYVGR